MKKPTDPVSATKPFTFTLEEARAFALATGNIKLVTQAELDEFLEPFVDLGLLATEYNRITGAIEHRNASGVLIAMTVGQRHFIHRRR